MTIFQVNKIFVGNKVDLNSQNKFTWYPWIKGHLVLEFGILKPLTDKTSILLLHPLILLNTFYTKNLYPQYIWKKITMRIISISISHPYLFQFKKIYIHCMYISKNILVKFFKILHWNFMNPYLFNLWDLKIHTRQSH